MKSLLIILLPTLFFIFFARDRTPAQTNLTSGEIAANRPIKIRMRIDPFGLVSLPQGFKVKRTLNTVDAWGGYIESADGKLKINFGAGMGRSLFVTHKKRFLWTRTEGTSKPIKIGWLRIKKADTLVARTGWTEFSAPISQETDKEVFMEIVRSYSREP